jgi:hypothetical protein
LSLGLNVGWSERFLFPPTFSNFACFTINVETKQIFPFSGKVRRQNEEDKGDRMGQAEVERRRMEGEIHKEIDRG